MLELSDFVSLYQTYETTLNSKNKTIENEEVRRMNKQDEKQRKKDIKEKENNALEKRRLERANERRKVIKKTLR